MKDIEQHVDPAYRASLDNFTSCLDDIVLLMDVVDVMNDWQLEMLSHAIEYRLGRAAGFYWMN